MFEAYNEIHVDEGGLGVRCEKFDIKLIVLRTIRLVLRVARSPFLRFAFCSGHDLILCGEKDGENLWVS